MRKPRRATQGRPDELKMITPLRRPLRGLELSKRRRLKPGAQDLAKIGRRQQD